MKRASVVALWLALAACRTPPLDARDAASSAGRVVCGASECALGSGQFCCTPYGARPSCVSTCAVGDWLKCDGPEDCPGQKCCSRLDPATGASTASCLPIYASCQLGTLCHSAADCVTGEVCSPINADLYPGVGLCSPS